MKRTVLHSLLLCLAAALATACADEYQIQGKSTVPVLDSQVLHLRAMSDGVAALDIDSCQVVHGRFSFYGDVDTVYMAELYFGTENIMPIVIENGQLYISLDNIGQRVTGGELNNRLYKYLNRQRKLDNEWSELQMQYIQMARKGKSPEDISKKLASKFSRNEERSEQLLTEFIIDNADNVLGTNYFLQLCGRYPIPVITEQISEILSEVPASFLSNPFVGSYVRQAQLNPMSKPCKLKWH